MRVMSACQIRCAPFGLSRAPLSGVLLSDSPSSGKCCALLWLRTPGHWHTASLPWAGLRASRLWLRRRRPLSVEVEVPLCQLSQGREPAKLLRPHTPRTPGGSGSYKSVSQFMTTPQQLLLTDLLPPANHGAAMHATSKGQGSVASGLKSHPGGIV